MNVRNPDITGPCRHLKTDAGYLQLEDSRVGAGTAAALEPVEHLCCRVDLVVVADVVECRHLVQVLCEPRCGTRQVDKAVLDHRGLRVHTHDLVRLRLIAGHGVEAFGNQLLDQLGPRGLGPRPRRHRGGSVHIARAPPASIPGIPCAGAIRSNVAGISCGAQCRNQATLTKRKPAPTASRGGAGYCIQMARSTSLAD